MSESAPDTKAGLHCPVCRVALVMTDRQNIEIDYCPQCRGVWLDRGELDKIIERSTIQAAPPQTRGGGRDTHDRDRYEGRGHGQGKHGYGKRGSRRKSWLHELFD